MECKNHSNNKSNNTCSICGQWFCYECVLEINGRIYCESCLKTKLSKHGQNENINDNEPNEFIVNILSLIPGCGQMYLGYIKRGISILLLFLVLGSTWLVYFSIAMWVFSIFDTINLKNNIKKGIYTEDSIRDIKKFAKDNKFLLILASILISIPFIFEFFNNMFYKIGYKIDKFEYILENKIRYNSENLIFFMGIVIIVLILIIYFNNRIRKKGNDEIIDKINNSNNNLKSNDKD